MTDRVLIVFQEADVAQLARDHQREADGDGIVVLECAPGNLAAPGEDDIQIFRHFERPQQFPRTYDIRNPELTFDMTETIQGHFGAFQTGGGITIESNPRGLWFVTPWEQRVFIGLARLHTGMTLVPSPPADRQVEHNEAGECPRPV